MIDENRDKFIYLAGRYSQTVKFHNVENVCASKLEEIRRNFPALKTHWLTVGAFFKCFIPDVLADLDKVIYLDSDIIVNLDIGELWRVDLGEKILGVVTELSNRRNVQNQFALVTDGHVKAENCFNSGVMLMNLNLLRAESQKITDAIKFIARNPKYQKYMDQEAINICFSTRALHLPTKFNRFAVSALAENNQTCERKIYHFVGQRDTLDLDMKNVLYRLWMEYFLKTPWFNVHSIGRLYENIQSVNDNMRLAFRKFSTFTSGKTRAFIVTPDLVEAVRKIFMPNDFDEIITVDFDENDCRNTVQMIFNEIVSSRNEKFFFILIQDFPFGALSRGGLTAGKDFLDAVEFLSQEHGFPLSTYQMLKGM
ncbi:MAG: hypothetical protein IJ774_04000 [Selenomonadaceae bacterium]|nr:hypothetical protein [Selenomonadaceae bacterium]